MENRGNIRNAAPWCQYSEEPWKMPPSPCCSSVSPFLQTIHVCMHSPTTALTNSPENHCLAGFWSRNVKNPPNRSPLSASLLENTTSTTPLPPTSLSSTTQSLSQPFHEIIHQRCLRFNLRFYLQPSLGLLDRSCHQPPPTWDLSPSERQAEKVEIKLCETVREATRAVRVYPDFLKNALDINSLDEDPCAYTELGPQR